MVGLDFEEEEEEGLSEERKGKVQTHEKKIY